MNRQTNSLARFLVLALIIAGGIIGFLTLVGITGLILPVLLGAVVGIGGLVLFCWGGTHLVGHLLYGNDPTYRRWCQNSDPWFDTLPPPFRAPVNQSSDNAPFHCPHCGTGVYSEVGVCPNCNYGAGMAVCSCGTTVAEPIPGAFTTTGVICPNCNSVLQSTPAVQPGNGDSNTLPYDTEY